MPNGSSPRISDGQMPPDGFASTEWSLVVAASAGGKPALDRLCRTYWRPVYVYIRATGVPVAEAEDAAQDFFADMLRRDWLKRANEDRGSFRGFLRNSVRLFLSNRRREAQAQKRGGGEQVIPIHSQECEQELERLLLDESSPAELYEQIWANCVLETALNRLADEQLKADKSEHFEQLRPFLMTPPGPGDYERIADRLKLSPNKVAVSVHRLSHRFGEVIRAEVAATLADQREVESELRHLLRLVSRQA